jgi:uncharacterized OsmC-like protein
VLYDQTDTYTVGEDRGPSPLDLMAVSVAACAHYFAAAYLHGRGLPTEGLSVEVESEKARLPVSRLGRLSMKVHLPVALDERQIAGIERAIKSCPAYGTLLHPPSVEISFHVEPYPACARQSA